jgi:hypothetical protein
MDGWAGCISYLLASIPYILAELKRHDTPRTVDEPIDSWTDGRTKHVLDCFALLACGEMYIQYE